MQLFSVVVFAFSFLFNRIGRKNLIVCLPLSIAFGFAFFFFLKFRQFSPRDFVFMCWNGIDGFYLWSFGNFFIGISY
jgi:hypothetical protein